MWNRIWQITGWTLGVSALFVMLGASVTTAKRAVLKEVKVDINYGEGNFFIDTEEVATVVSDLGYVPEQSLMIDIDPARIEYVLENDPYIRDAQVYEDVNGVLHVDVKVRQPVLRVYSRNGRSVYIDAEGTIMPLSKSFAAHTPVANGFIQFDFESVLGENIGTLADSLAHRDVTIVRDMHEIAGICRKDKFWKAQFNQFYVNQDREIEMIPRVGDHYVLVGDARNMDKKLNKLRLFYKEGLDKTGWNEYKYINLKYANQVVCTKS